MEITHNEINNAILKMEVIVAKANKDRRIRTVLREMRREQGISPSARDIWGYIKIWLIDTIKRLNR